MVFFPIVWEWLGLSALWGSISPFLSDLRNIVWTATGLSKVWKRFGRKTPGLPRLVLRFPERNLKDAPNHDFVAIHNPTQEPAYGVQVALVDGGEYRAEFEPVPVVGAGQDVFLRPTVTKINLTTGTHEGSHALFVHDVRFFRELLRAGEPTGEPAGSGPFEDKDTTIRWTFTDKDGNPGEGSNRVRCAAAKGRVTVL